ncbi:MAG: PLP-dependent transferase [Maricaulaceae bacterium]|nr:PLP-dependent transferase [Maricaulaceae bacterium]
MSAAIDTRAAQAGINTDPGWGAVTPPLHLSTAFRRAAADAPGAFDYARTDNPSRRLLADVLAELEGGEGAVVTASGMAAIDLLLNDLPAGARVVCSHDAYGGTRRLFDARSKQGRIAVTYADTGDLAALERALRDGAALVLVETPSNPRLRISDIAACAALARQAGAKLAVDNTVLSPALQRPLTLGADYSVQSATKLLNGHSDMVGGAVACARTEEAERLAWWANCAGTGGAAFDCWLALRGLRTLPLRARAQSEAALRIARWLAARGDVGVDYPGLPDHPGHALAARQQTGFGPLLSFAPRGGTKRARAVVKRLRLFTLAQSLGGVESLACIPALMTHAAMSAAARAGAGVGDDLIRLSCGLEAAEDLIADLEQGLGGPPTSGGRS